MAKRGGGITCALALMFHAMIVVSVLVSGATKAEIFYTEALLLLGGSTIALLGGLVLSGRSRSDRCAIGTALGMTLVALSWMLWSRDNFGLDLSGYRYHRIFSFYGPLPKPNIDWISATWKSAVWIIAMWMLGVAVILLAIRAIGRWSMELMAKKALSRRVLLIGLAAFLYLGFLIQSQLLRPDQGLFGSSAAQWQGFWLFPFSLLVPTILACSFFLPRQHRYAWLLLICIGIFAFAMEVTYRMDLAFRGTITTLVIVGFVGSGFWLRRFSISEPAESEPSKLRIGRAAWITAPAAMFLVAGWMFVRTVDVGQWVLHKNYALATRVAGLRSRNIEMEPYPWGMVKTKLGRNAPVDAFEQLLQDWPDVGLQHLIIDGMRPDIDVSSLVDGNWRNVGRGARPGWYSIQFASGELSVSQLAELLNHNDVQINGDVSLIESNAGLDEYSNLDSLHLYGKAESIIGKLQSLKPNKAIDTLTVTVYSDAGLLNAGADSRELAVMLLENSWGKRLVVNFRVPLESVQWLKPGGECPWESIQFNLHEADWKFLLSKMSGSKPWPIRLSTRGNIDSSKEEILYLRCGIGSNGMISPTISSSSIRVFAENSFHLSFERFDCVVRRDEQGNPVALLALDADWISHLSDEQCGRLDSLWIGSEWGGVGVFDEVLPGSAHFLGRCTGLRRLGLGLNEFDDYSFLQKMPELREFQISGETAPERIADLVANLKFVSKLERFQISDIPAPAITMELAKLPNLKEVVLVGVEESEMTAGPLADIRKMLPGVEIRLLTEIGFSDLRPADLVEHQKAMLERVMKEIELEQALGIEKIPED